MYNEGDRGKLQLFMVTVTLPLGGADARQPSSNEHADAAPPDDDGIWRGDAAIGNKLNSAGLDPKELKAAQLMVHVHTWKMGSEM